MLFDSLRGRLHSKQNASAFTGCSVSYIDRLIRKGAIQVVRISPKMTRIDGDSLANFLQAQAQLPSKPRGKSAR